MRFDAWYKIETELKNMGLYWGKENHKMAIGVCSKTGDIIEPMLKPQWYMNC